MNDKDIIEDFVLDGVKNDKMKILLNNNQRISYFIHGILIPIIGAIGLGGNVIGIGYVTFLNTRKRHYTFYLLLLVLFLFDLTFIVSVVLTFSLRELLPKLYKDPVPTAIYYLDYIAFPMSILTLFGSIYFTVAICFERYMAICSPLFYRTKKHHSFIYILSIFCFVVFVNIPRFFEVNIIQDENGDMDLELSSLRNNRIYYYVYGVGFKFLFQYIIPYTILIVLNIKIWKVLRLQNISNIPMPSERAAFHIHMSSNTTNQRRMQSELAKLSLIMVILLMICTPIGLINDIYEVFHGIQEVTQNNLYLLDKFHKKIV